MIIKKCECCKTAGAAVYCRADAAFLCVNCDSKIHDQQQTLLVPKHERVWVCDVCEQAPAAFSCKADSALLCVSCDADIHCANHLANRHLRLPVQSFFDSADSFLLSRSSDLLLQLDEPATPTIQPSDEYAPGDADFKNTEMRELKGEYKNDPFFPNLDSNFLGLEYPESIEGGFHNFDGVVPVHNILSTVPVPAQLIMTDNSSSNNNGLNQGSTKLMSYSFNCSVPTHTSLNRQSMSTSSSSLDIGVVPDGNSFSDISFPFIRSTATDQKMPTPFISPITTTNNKNSNANPTTQSESASGGGGGGGGGNMNREARVLRYRERRKNRKFEKTIRYASRKAYAETRPRIKGRFAKRTNDHKDVIQSSDDAGSLYNSILNNSTFNLPADDTQYGVVPAF